MLTVTKYSQITKQVTCYCNAYAFPHRLDSKACKELYNSEVLTEDYRAGVMRDFDRVEANAINATRGMK